ncbi:hypothetical protein CGLO_16208 [Colletotrichum gloeosporioides Cg-14]|uniref:RRM domain-containing protein n=1 Tax=Colletotrichum gloeosporioides (strain Cg-14) TaxID=1237896 RepID=T0JZU0_COLGC|nr:hypothetical protein CGLO_16208 [Colletotrichum gloeosporioides Cg-14]
MTEVSSTRLYLGNLPRTATKADVEAHFATHGTGEITEIKLMNGFGFIEYKDAMDARDVVPELTHFIRLNPICLLATSAARARVRLADDALIRFRWTTTIGVALHEVTVRAEMDIVTAIVSAALVESTTMIALDTDPLLAALWMITLHREAAMTIPTVETILRHPIPMPMADPTTVLRETSLLEMGRTLVMGTLASMTVVAVTDPGGAQNMFQYRDRVLASSLHWAIRKERM